jgi:multicomponent K+:H+ antiporter subunit F
MSGGVLALALTVSHLLLAAAMLAATWRILTGPRAQDRVVGLDALYMNGMLLLLTLGIRYGTDLYFEAALVIALLGFASTAALARFLLRGEVIE